MIEPQLSLSDKADEPDNTIHCLLLVWSSAKPGNPRASESMLQLLLVAGWLLPIPFVFSFW